MSSESQETESKLATERQTLSYVSKDYVIRGSLVDLSDADQVWNALDKRVRTSIRKGQALGVQIRPLETQDPVELAFLREITPNRDDIPAEFTGRFHGYVALARENGERLGWILLAEADPKKLFMLCHASTTEGKRRQTPNLLLWHVIQTWARNSFQFLDVGGSYRASLQNYFSGFRQVSYPLILRPPELQVPIRLTPYDTQSLGQEFGNSVHGRQRLEEVFGTDEFTFFPRARYAIAGCLNEYRLQGRLDANSEVLMTTTSDSPYISRCVTQAIESVCEWSRKPSEKTAAVFLIHEFGFPHPRAAEWRAFCDQRGIPLIEDVAYGWGSEGTGIWGDVKIYSATKLFPVPFGGFLVGMRIPFERHWTIHRSADPTKEQLTYGLLDACWQPLSEIRSQRRTVWERYAEELRSVSDPYFELPLGVMPGAYLARLVNQTKAEEVKTFVTRFGVEMSVWYHHPAIFLPCHQRLTASHVDYVAGAVLACFREGCGIPPS